MAEPSISIKWTGQWAKLAHLLDTKRFGPRMRLLINRATIINAAIVRKDMRKNIQRGLTPRNAALTTMLKGSSKPGVDSGQLFKAITSVYKDAFTAEVGVKKGTKAADLAKIVHDGARIPVTQKMRDMFSYLAMASKGEVDPASLTGRAKVLWQKHPGGWKGLRGSTTHIVIPPRPFVHMTIENADIRDKLGHNWTQAFSAALAGKDTFDAKR